MRESIKNIEDLLVNGQFEKVDLALEKIGLNSLSRSEIGDLANLARRAGYPELSLFLLNPIVRPKNLKQMDPSPYEKAVYAGALIKVGALDEALDILNDLPSKELPLISLFKAHANIVSWNYAEAIQPLNQYLSSKQLNPVEIFLGQMNLAACYVYERDLQNGDLLLKELLNHSKKEELYSFHGNVLELSAQWAIHNRDWKQARDLLSKAQDFFKNSDSPYSFFVRKWQVVLDFCEGKTPGKCLDELMKVREEAIRKKLWESVRDCDFWKGIKTANEDLLIHLYFGTPFESFRKRIFLEYGKQIEMPKAYHWNPEHFNQPGKKKIDALNLKNSKTSDKLIQALVSDFYRPLRVGELYTSLFPGEYFNPDSSPMRVYQAIKTLREYFKQKKVPLEVLKTQDGYHLEIKSGYSLLVPKAGEMPASIDRLDLIREKFQDSYFSTADIVKALDVSKTTAKRIVKEAMEANQLEKEGHGSVTIYTFSKKKLAA